MIKFVHKKHKSPNNKGLTIYYSRFDIILGLVIIILAAIAIYLYVRFSFNAPGQINRPAIEIHNLIRGISPQPGAWCWVQVGADKKRLKIKRSEVVDTQGYFGENLVLKEIILLVRKLE